MIGATGKSRSSLEPLDDAANGPRNADGQREILDDRVASVVTGKEPVNQLQIELVDFVGRSVPANHMANARRGNASQLVSVQFIGTMTLSATAPEVRTDRKRNFHGAGSLPEPMDGRGLCRTRVLAKQYHADAILDQSEPVQASGEPGSALSFPLHTRVEP